MFKIKNKILLLILSLQIFANFNSEVLCSRTDAQGLHIATAVAKYLAFATSNAYGLKGDESKELTLENIYLALDAFDSLLKIDYFLSRKVSTEASGIAVLCESGSVIYDLVTFMKNVIKLKENGNNKIKKNNNKKAVSKNQKLSPLMKKKIFYTFLKHSAMLSEVACSIDFAGDSGEGVRRAESILSIFLKVFSRCFDNKIAEIPHKAFAGLSLGGVFLMSNVVALIKQSDARWKRCDKEQEWKKEDVPREEDWEEPEWCKKQNEYWEKVRKDKEAEECRRQENMTEDERHEWQEQQDRNKKEQEKRQKEWDDYIESLRRGENARREKEWQDRFSGYGSRGFYGARHRNHDFWGDSYGFGDSDFGSGGAGSSSWSGGYRPGSSGYGNSGFGSTGSGFYGNNFGSSGTGSSSWSSGYRPGSSGYGSSGFGSTGSGSYGNNFGSGGTGSSSWSGGSDKVPKYNSKPTRPIPSRTTFYNLLGVSSDATLSEINRNYKKIALKTHPDKGGSKEQFQVVANAKEILLNSEKRKKYDSYLKGKEKEEPNFNIPDNIAKEIKKIRAENKI